MGFPIFTFMPFSWYIYIYIYAWYNQKHFIYKMVLGQLHSSQLLMPFSSLWFFLKNLIIILWENCNKRNTNQWVICSYFWCLRSSLSLTVYRESILAGITPTIGVLSRVLGCLQFPYDASLKSKIIDNLGVTADPTKFSNLFSLVEGFGEYDPRAFSLLEVLIFIICILYVIYYEFILIYIKLRRIGY